MAKFSARYFPKDSDPKDKIEKLMPIFELFAEVFRVNIRVDCHDGALNSLNTNSDHLYFHIDCYPARFSVESNIFSSVFGYVPSEEILVATPPRNQLPKEKKFHHIFDMDNNNLGCVVGSHIFIYPSIITDKAWSDEIRFKLVESLCYLSIPWALYHLFSGSREKIDFGLDVLRQKLRNSFLSSNLASEVQKRFREFIVRTNEKMIKNLREKSSEIEKKVEDLSKTYFDLIFKNISNKFVLNSIRDEVGKRDFGQEFESILGMESIESITVENNRCLFIKTGDITQIPNPHESAPTFNIGDFLIEIDSQPAQGTSVLSRICIGIHQLNPGPYRHFHVSETSNNTCYGSVLNPIIDKLMLNFDIRPIVNLILTFLKREKTPPTVRKDYNSSKEKLEDGAYDREEAKKQFCNLASRVVLATSITTLDREIRETDVRIESIHKEILKLQIELHNQNLALDRAINFVYSDPEIDSEASKLVGEGSILNLAISDKFMLIHTYHDRGIKTRLGIATGDLIIKIRIDSMPEFFIPLSKKTLQKLSLFSMKNGELKGDGLMILENIRCGRIVDVINMVKYKIENTEFGSRHHEHEEGKGVE